MNATSNETQPGMVRWSLAGCQRIHGVTIRQIASHMGITMKRVREVRNAREVREITAWDFVRAIKEIAAQQMRTEKS